MANASRAFFVLGANLQQWTHTYNFDDPEIAVASNVATAPFGPLLPVNAIVLGVSGAWSQWTDGAGAIVAGNMQKAPFTLLGFDLSGGPDEGRQVQFAQTGAGQINFVVNADVNLDTLIAGTVDVAVLFVVAPPTPV